MEYINSFELCNFCTNHILFNKKNSNDFLTKFLYNGFNKKILTLAFRLNPKLIEFVRFDYYKKLFDVFSDIKLPTTCDKNGYIHMFEIYFNQENLKYDDFENCSFCNKYYCPLHLKIAPFKTFKCDCDKEIRVCNDCYHERSEKILCALLHLL